MGELEKDLKIFKKRTAGQLKEVRGRRHFIKPSEIKREKIKEARRKNKQNNRWKKNIYKIVNNIDKNIIKTVLEDSDIDEEKNIKKLINKNKWRWSRYDKDIKKKKMSEYLMRKGFGWDLVKNVVNWTCWRRLSV